MIGLVRLMLTDSGLGGLSICAALERDLRGSPLAGRVRLTYVNAWPEEGRGYNDFSNDGERAEVFDRALEAMAALKPDRLLIACNTLSILFEDTAFSRAAVCPVEGIVDCGVALFEEELRSSPASSIVLLGTRTTISSGAHRRALIAAGVAPERIGSVSCHGLATAIERDIGGPRVTELIEAYASDVGEAVTGSQGVWLGLCCTHYGYVADRLASAVAAATGRCVRALDPNVRMVRDAMGRLLTEAVPAGKAAPAVEVVSKVALDDRTRAGISTLVRPVSPATAEALIAYRHAPTLF